MISTGFSICWALVWPLAGFCFFLVGIACFRFGLIFSRALILAQKAALTNTTLKAAK